MKREHTPAEEAFLREYAELCTRHRMIIEAVYGEPLRVGVIESEDAAHEVAQLIKNEIVTE